MYPETVDLQTIADNEAVTAKYVNSQIIKNDYSARTLLPLEISTDTLLGTDKLVGIIYDVDGAKVSVNDLSFLLINGMQYNLTAIGATVSIVTSIGGRLATRVTIGGLSADLLATVKDNSSAALMCHIGASYTTLRSFRDASKGPVKDAVLATPIDISTFNSFTNYYVYPYRSDKMFTNYENLGYSPYLYLNTDAASATIHGGSNGSVATPILNQFSPMVHAVTPTSTNQTLATTETFVPNCRAPYNSMTAADNYFSFTVDDYFSLWYYSRTSYYGLDFVPQTYYHPIGGLMLYTNEGKTLYIAGRNEVHLSNAGIECWSRQTDRAGRPLAFPPGKYYMTALATSTTFPYTFISAMFPQKCLEPAH